MHAEPFRSFERVVLDVFRYGDGWMLKRRGDPEVGVVVATRERAIELGAARAANFAEAELVIRDLRGNVEEVHRLGLIARRKLRRSSRPGARAATAAAAEVGPGDAPQDSMEGRGVAGGADAA